MINFHYKSLGSLIIDAYWALVPVPVLCRSVVCRLAQNGQKLSKYINTYLEPFGAIWSYLELLGVIWSYLEIQICVNQAGGHFEHLMK